MNTKKGINDFIEFVKSNRWYFIVFCGGFLLLAYGFKTFNYSPFIDTGTLVLDPEYFWKFWLMIDRYGAVFTKLIFGYIRPELASVYIMTMLFIFLGGITWSYLFYYIREDKNYPKYQNVIIPVLFSTAPCLYEMLHFECIAFEGAFAYFISGVALLLIYKAVCEGKGRVLYSIIGIILLTWSFATYQAFVFFNISVIIAIVLMILKHRTFANEKEVVKTGIIFTIYFLISYVLYIMIGNVIRLIFNLAKDDYLSVRFLWGKEKNIVVIKNILMGIKRAVLAELPEYSLIFLVGTVAVLMMVILQIKKCHSFVYIGCIIALYVSPFILMIVTGSITPQRGELSLIFVSGFSIYFFISTIGADKKKIIGLITLITLVFSFRQASMVSRLSYTDYNVYQQEIRLTTQISDRVGKLGLGEIPKEPVVFIGGLSSVLNSSMQVGDTTSHTNFNWDRGGEYGVSLRVREIMGMQGIIYNRPSVENVQKAREISKDMPSWPDENSVAVKEGMVIVKLSEL